jgi:seryl-tRNA synthetase
MPVTLDKLPGLQWIDNGQSVLSGAPLELTRRLDRAFVRLAEHWSAAEYQFPTFIPAAALDELDYFRSFPHLATFPVALDPDERNLERFTVGQVLDGEGSLRLTTTSPIRDVLTPAACYHFYVNLRDRDLDAPCYLTTRNTCFRREAFYRPLERQWSFSMREIVCIGTLDEVKTFLARTQTMVGALLEVLGLPVEWAQATDPFFKPATNPGYLMQKLDPVKLEAVFGDALAISSVNLHQDHFGATYRIRRDGRTAFSGCVAFGLERWLLAIVTTHGPDERDWPSLPAVGA